MWGSCSSLEFFYFLSLLFSLSFFFFLLPFFTLALEFYTHTKRAHTYVFFYAPFSFTIYTLHTYILPPLSSFFSSFCEKVSTYNMAAQQTRQTGRVKFFNSTKGYGFIIPDDPSGQGKTEGILLSSTRKIAINSHIYWYHHRHCFTTIANLNFRRRFCTPHRNIQQWRVQESGRGKWTERDSPGLSARIWVLCVCGNRAKRYIKTVKSIYLLFLITRENASAFVLFCENAW